MSGNTTGSVFRVTTWGESHGRALGAVVDGCPPGISLKASDIQQALDRRKPSASVASTTRKEGDLVEILSGVFEGKTIGTPISLIIRNADAQSSSYDALKNVFRPGQGDFTYLQKYGIRDWRGGGRASGRETAARVAAGAIAAKILDRVGIDVIAYTKAIGSIAIDRSRMPAEKNLRTAVQENALFCPDPQTAAGMERKITAVRKKGDSLGGIVEIIVRGCPGGLGEPVFDKMDADLAKVAKKLGDVPEAKEILAVIERVGDLHQQFVRVFDVVHEELEDAQTGLGCLIKSMPKLDAGDLPPNELACLLGPLHKRLAEATSLLGMLGRG